MKLLIFHVKSQFVIIVRYVKDFEPVERFLKFVELQDRTAIGITQALKENLDSLNLESKLIAQAYDGAAVMRVSINGIQVQMKKFFPHAYYVHCYAHQLNLIIKKMGSCNKRLKLFFSSLNKIGVFSLFHQSAIVSSKNSVLLRYREYMRHAGILYLE